MSLYLHEIAEANHKILNPFTEEKLMTVAAACRLRADSTVLDLACGKAEMLAQWAHHYRISGVGVDISSVFIEAARARVEEMGLVDRIHLVEQDAASYHSDVSFDVVSCIGATWIGNGIVGTLKLMQEMVKPDGILLVGEPYWIDPPTPEAMAAIDMNEEDYVSLEKTFERISEAGYELVEMVLANQDSWDRYEAGQWRTLDEWLRNHDDDHPQAAEVRHMLVHGRDTYIRYQRRYLGWGVFVLRMAR